MNIRKNKIAIAVGMGLTTLFSNLEAASIPKLAWPSTTHKTSLQFGGDWTRFASQCTQIMWKHVGVDITAPKASSVYAAEAGKVKVSQNSNSSWKEWITIEHKDKNGNAYDTSYWHLANRKVKVGDTVSRGQEIAAVADMGSNSHLHFGVYNAGYSNTANRGGLPTTNNCTGFPAFPASFVNPLNYLPTN